jgi:hypothetical protein
MQEEDVQALRTAKAVLEHPRFAARLAEIAGKPIELFNRALPEPASKAIAVATTQALRTALRVALRTLQNDGRSQPSPNRRPFTFGPNGGFVYQYIRGCKYTAKPFSHDPHC